MNPDDYIDIVQDGRRWEAALRMANGIAVAIGRGNTPKQALKRLMQRVPVTPEENHDG